MPSTVRRHFGPPVMGFSPKSARKTWQVSLGLRALRGEGDLRTPAAILPPPSPVPTPGLRFVSRKAHRSPCTARFFAPYGGRQKVWSFRYSSGITPCRAECEFRAPFSPAASGRRGAPERAPVWTKPTKKLQQNARKFGHGRGFERFWTLLDGAGAGKDARR
jgi:hypothetical protein